MKEKKRILIVEDHTIVRQELQSLQAKPRLHLRAHNAFDRHGPDIHLNFV